MREHRPGPAITGVTLVVSQSRIASSTPGDTLLAFIQGCNVKVRPVPIEFSAPGTILEMESEPVGPMAIYGRGNRVRIGKNVRLSASVWINGDDCLLEIGDDCDIMGLIHILHGGGSLRIGRGTTATGVGISMHEAGEIVIGAGCMLSTEIHMDVSDAHPIYDAATGERLNPPKPITLEDRVWLAARVIVMKGATIGEGTVVGAGSVVVGALPPGCLAAGTPARPLRENVVWRRDFDEPALVADAAAEDKLPEGFCPQPATPFPGKPPAQVSGSEIARDERFGKALADLPPGPTRGMQRLPQYSPCYLDKAGAAFDPLNNPDASTPRDEPIDLRGFAFDGPGVATGGGGPRARRRTVPGSLRRLARRRRQGSRKPGGGGLRLCADPRRLRAFAGPTHDQRPPHRRRRPRLLREPGDGVRGDLAGARPIARAA
jgi:acetyltransferase-like isoleucine patch superfamily enzyme